MSAHYNKVAELSEFIDQKVGMQGVMSSGVTQERPMRVISRPANENRVTTGSDAAKPANAGEVTTGFGAELSASEPQAPPPVPSTN